MKKFSEYQSFEFSLVFMFFPFLILLRLYPDPSDFPLVIQMLPLSHVYILIPKSYAYSFANWEDGVTVSISINSTIYGTYTKENKIYGFISSGRANLEITNEGLKPTTFVIGQATSNYAKDIYYHFYNPSGYHPVDILDVLINKSNSVILYAGRKSLTGGYIAIIVFIILAFLGSFFIIFNESEVI